MGLGGLDSFLGGSGGGSLGYEAPDPQDLIYGGGFGLMNFMLAGLFSLAGGELTTGGKKDYVPGLYDKKGKPITFKKAANKGLGGVIDKGDGTYAVLPSQAQVQEQLGKFQTQQIGVLKSNYEKLFGEDTPAFLQNIKDEAMGKSQSILDFGKYAADINQKAIGASSFGYDPNVKKFLTAPLALDFIKFKYGVQKGGESQLLNQIGANQLFNPLSYGQAVTPNFVAGLGTQGAQIGLGAEEFKFGAAQAFNTAGLGAGFLGGLAGGGLQQAGLNSFLSSIAPAGGAGAAAAIP